MKKRDCTLSTIANNEMKGHALYTVECRAIPNMIDGLKPVQRFYLFSSIKNSRKEFRKVSAIAGVVSDYGYNHGESSAADTGTAMAAEWNNNICLIQGRGAFGSRQIPVSGAARYIYTKVHENFDHYITDLELSPKHPDPEHEPPRHYLPVIPLVLSNGISGIATGFATNILPRSTDSLIKCCLEYINKGKVESYPTVSFPQFKGTVEQNAEGKYIASGIMSVSKSDIVITEIPPGVSREKYIAHLDKLENAGSIESYTDECDDTGFRFVVHLKRGHALLTNHTKAMATLKLEKSFSENLTVIDWDGKLRVYDDVRDLIADFCEFRMGILAKRIRTKIDHYTRSVEWLGFKAAFVEAVLDDRIVFKNKKKQQLVNEISALLGCSETDSESLLRMNFTSLTKEMIDDLRLQIKNEKETLSYWDTTATPKEQFNKDLSAL